MATRIPSNPRASVQQHENLVSNIEDQIRRLAYELYQQRGMEDGHDVEDWLRAEECATLALPAQAARC